MPVLITCKFDEDPIKIERATMSTTFFQVLKGSNSEVNSWIWPKLASNKTSQASQVSCNIMDKDYITQAMQAGFFFKRVTHLAFAILKPLFFECRKSLFLSKRRPREITQPNSVRL